MTYPTPQYRIILRKFTGPYDYSPGPVIAEIENFWNLGYADYVNDVPEAFFTMLQKDTDARIDLMRNYEGRAHVEVYRNGDMVWRGWLMESDANDRDVVFYCYGYLAGFYWAATEWAATYTNQNIGQIVTAEVNQARNRQISWTGSGGAQNVGMLRWLTMGTIQTPVTTSGGSTPLILPEYKVHHKRVLFLLRELSAIAMSDTTNTVVFEITPEPVPRFNYWKDRSIDRPTIRLDWGDDQMMSFRHLRAAANKRNRLLGVGQNPNNIVLRQNATGTGELAEWGLREEALYLAWVRDQDEIIRVASQRLARARRIDNDLAVRLMPNSLAPPTYINAGWNLTDRIKVRIDHGVTNIDGWFHTIGYQTTVGRSGVENVNVLLQELVGV